MKIEWPNRATIPPGAFAALLEQIPGDVLATRFDIGEDLVRRWEEHGVPAGHHAALIRYFAEANGIALEASATCLLCGSPAAHSVGHSDICDECALDPIAALEGLSFQTEMVQSGTHTGLRVEPPTSLEAPLRASFSHTKQSLLGKVADPEIGHPEFDDAVHIESDDYMALFDLLQHPRRRELIQSLSEDGTVIIDVDVVSFWYRSVESTPAFEKHTSKTPRIFRTSPLEIRRYWLRIGLLAWSLVNERSPSR